MRIVSKINLALAAVVAVSAALNLAALEATVSPRFAKLEDEAALKNQERVLEAVQLQKDQLAASARDYAFWDDSFAYMHGRDDTYEAKNLLAEPMKALNVNFYLAVRPDGRVKIDRGFDYSGDEPREIRLLSEASLPEGHPLREAFPAPESRTGLVLTSEGIVAVGYAPVLDTERKGPQAGVLLFGKLLDLDQLRSATKVDFELRPAVGGSADKAMSHGDDVIEVRSTLTDVTGAPIADVVSKTSRSVSAAGEQAVWAAMVLLALGGMTLIAALAYILRRIALRRIQRMQRHLVRIKATGALENLPEDTRGDELSDMIAAFNDMTGELEALRERLRRRDYQHGAADQAAEILHNIRNAVSPISAIVADLGSQSAAPWKANLAKALEELGATDLAPDRRAKLQQFVALSAARVLEEEKTRGADFRTLQGIVRHVDGILRDEEAVSRMERVLEAVELKRQIAGVSHVIARRPGVTVDVDVADGLKALGHRMPLEQVWGNLLLNAAEAIDAAGRGEGTIRVQAVETAHGGAAALEIIIADDGDGVPPELIERMFEKGFSTRRDRSGGLGLHWSANAIAAMGGRIFAESEGLGCGTRLHVILPRADAELRSAA